MHEALQFKGRNCWTYSRPLMDSNLKESDAKVEKEDIDAVSAEAETYTIEEGTNSMEITDQIEEDTNSTERTDKIEEDANSIERTDKIEEDANSIEIIVGEDPLHKAYENMHLDTIVYLLKAIKDDGKTALQSSLAGSVHPGVVIGVDLLVNAISAKQYTLDDFWDMLATAALFSLFYFVVPAMILFDEEFRDDMLFTVTLTVIVIVPSWLASAFILIYVLILLVCSIFVHLYFILWKGATILPCKSIESPEAIQSKDHYNYNESFNGVRK
ncbi:hypothetical protein L1987_01602 [Smallanthus sonchifolius]|uniref:Uncharacterized protein n=1 Tax=Smallanthus sonchifolius TaxID=185202 RepID=A0ACB9K5R4_9ASTR|nr:hypothetical protein L1987_01602 [Smallanthus sonchifolius]